MEDGRPTGGGYMVGIVLLFVGTPSYSLAASIAEKQQQQVSAFSLRVSFYYILG